MTRDQIEALITSDGELVAGRTVFEQLSEQKRPSWASGVLLASIGCVDNVPYPVRRVLQLGSGPTTTWREGHSAFQAVRRVTMRLDEKRYGRLGLSNNEERLHHILVLAEFVAKVIYNSSLPLDGFDEESGWNVLPVARDLMGVVGDAVFEDRLWAAVLQK